MRRKKRTADRDADAVSFQEMARLLGRAHRRFLQVVNASLEAHGLDDLTPSQALVLLEVGADGGSLHDLAEAGAFPPPPLAAALGALEESGYVETAGSDGGSPVVRLTEQGDAMAGLLAQIGLRGCSPLLSLERNAADAEAAVRTLRRLDWYWKDHLREQASS